MLDGSPKIMLIRTGVACYHPLILLTGFADKGAGAEKQRHPEVSVGVQLSITSSTTKLKHHLVV
jgi:hypothetical protein